MRPHALIAALVGAVVSFLLGWLVWGILFMDYYSNNLSELYIGYIQREEPVLWMIFIANILWAYLLVYIFDSIAGINNMMDGFKAGAVIFFLITAGLNIMFHATADMYANHTIIVVDIVLNTVFGGIIGGVVGFMLGRNKESASN